MNKCSLKEINEQLMTDQCKTKSTSSSAVMEEKENNNQENLIHLKRLKDGYASIVDKIGCTKFKPYLQRLFNSIETMLEHEETEYKKIDAKYQDMVRQCHIYEKTLSMLKENNCCEMSSFSESSNTYALEDLTKVTPYLAPDLLQSTLGATNGGGGSTSLQFRLPRQRSSLSNRQYVSTPLGPTRTLKPAVPLAHFDDDSSFGFQQQPAQQKQFVDASTDPILIPQIEQKDFSCQMTPVYTDQQIETIPLITEYHSTQTDMISTETIACQINPQVNDDGMQTDIHESKDFSCQFMPTSIDQITETIQTEFHTQMIQTDSISTNDYSCQINPISIDQQIETIPIVTEDIGLQCSFLPPTFDDQQIQTDMLISIDVQTQYEYDTSIIPIVFTEELPIEIVEKLLFDQECQTINNNIQIQSTQTPIIDFQDCACQSSSIIYENESTQTTRIDHQDCASQSSIITYENQSIQTEFHSNNNNYSSSLYIIPQSLDQSIHSSKLVILPRDSPIILTCDQQIQCEYNPIETDIPIPIQTTTKINDRRSLIQHQMDEKEKQMNRIIEEYATLYGEYESERRRNMDLTEARDRLADHIKVLSDELGDREINQEKLLIKSCQQNKLINYMLPQIDCSPMPRKKHHSASSFRRLLPKFK